MAQSSRIKNKIAIVGAGPAGIYCAVNILEQCKSHNYNDFFIDIFDKSQALRTILKTGNGRCNITNAIEDMREFCANYPRGEKFFYSLFSKHSNKDALDFFKKIGIETYIQDDLRVFPKSNSAKEVKDKLLNYLNSFKNIKLINKKISSIKELSTYNYIVISTGSKDTSDLIKSTNQPYIDFKPALTSLVIKDGKYPQGVSVKSLDGEFIFTDNGISGPLIFKLSSMNVEKKLPYTLKINLFDINELIELIKDNPKKSIGNLVSNFIPKSLSRVIVKNYDKNACEISKKELESYTNITFEIINTSKGNEIVNFGGIDLKYLDKNCKSKINDKLWFCGEILNIDGFCGGFNLQNCWSSAYVVSYDIINKMLNNKE